VNQYVDGYNTRIVERLGGAPPLAKSVADKNNFAPRLGVVWVPTADRKTTLRASGGVYYDQNHWNITDIYINETLLAKRRINLNANSAANNPFWTPGNTAVGIAQMRAFLAEKFPAYPDLSALPFPLEAILAVEPHYKIPYSVNFAVGMTRQISNTLTARADYVRTRTYDSMRGPDTNWAVTSDGRYVRKDARYGNITIIGNGGSLWYNGLETRVDYRPSATARAGLSYTLSKAMSDTATGLSTGGSTNPFDPSEDYGPDNNDRRHNLVVDATYLVPRIDLQLAGTTAYRSALPYTITTSFQLDTDPFSDRPEPRNSRRGDAARITDLRASKIFRFGRYTATAFWEVFNVFNVDNWRNPSGNLESSNFGLSLAQGPKRQQQFGFRFDF
jgi:hypothetical protein